MDCKEMQEWVSAAVDDELSVEEEKSLRVHLTTCQACRTMYTEWKELSHYIRMEFSRIEAPIGLENKIMSTVLSRGNRRDFIRVNFAALILATIVALIFAGILVSPVASLSWSAIHFVGLGVRTSVAHHGMWFDPLLPSNGTVLRSVLCFGLTVACMLSVVQIHRRWRTA